MLAKTSEEILKAIKLLTGQPLFPAAQLSLLPAGVPLKPMLAKISEGIPDAIKQLKAQPFLAEFKYDGMRSQIHLLPDGSVKIFSRNCEERTVAYPDVVAAIRQAAQGEGECCGMGLHVAEVLAGRQAVYSASSV